jgi:predicted dithiol-disulfide oxidoreductase (DUF899 family)
MNTRTNAARKLNNADSPLTPKPLHSSRFPNESDAYRAERDALLHDEIELRRQNERVAARRRGLPLGGKVPEDYLFEGEAGPVRMSELFGRHDTLVTYNYMFGPRRERPCPSCTSMLSGLDGIIRDVEQRIAFVVVARSPIARLRAFKAERGWRHLRLVSSAQNSFNRDYFGDLPDGSENPMHNVFVRREGAIHHFYGSEMGAVAADYGQHSRDGDSFWPLWGLLDLTPAGRGHDWMPALDYER